MCTDLQYVSSCLVDALNYVHHFCICSFICSFLPIIQCLSEAARTFFNLCHWSGKAMDELYETGFILGGSYEHLIDTFHFIAGINTDYSYMCLGCNGVTSISSSNTTVGVISVDSCQNILKCQAQIVLNKPRQYLLKHAFIVLHSDLHIIKDSLVWCLLSVISSIVISRNNRQSLGTI